MARVRLTPIAIAIAVTSLALVAYCAGRSARQASDRAAQWQRDAQAALQAAAGAARVSDSLRRLETALRATLARRRPRVDTLRIQAESILVHDTIKAAPLLAAALDECHAALSMTDTVITSCGRRAALERARGDSLARVLAAGIPLVECRMLGLRFLPRCPGRMATLFLGGALGAGATLLLQRH